MPHLAQVTAVVDGDASIAGITADPWSRLLVLAVLSYFAVYSVVIVARRERGRV